MGVEEEPDAEGEEAGGTGRAGFQCMKEVLRKPSSGPNISLIRGSSISPRRLHVRRNAFGLSFAFRLWSTTVSSLGNTFLDP